MARKRATLTDLLNHNTAKTIYDKFKLLCLNDYEYGNLPAGIDTRHIEKLLFHKGLACFFRAPGMDYMVLECSPDGRVNVYGDPLGWQVYGYNYHKHINTKDCVIIKNNLLSLPTEPFILHYVNKLTEAERTMDVNIKACKTPVVFTCDDKDVLSFKRLWQETDGNVPAHFVDKGLNLDAIQAFQTGVKFMGIELMDYKRSVESDLLTFLGQNNTPVDKKERLITDEAEANNQLIDSFADLQFQAREKAVKEINEKFGLNITLTRRNVEKGVDNGEKEGVNDDVI